MQDVDNDAASAPMDGVEDANQTHAHHKVITTEISNDGDDAIQGPDYTPTCDESSPPDNEKSRTMVATTLEQQHKDEVVDLNNADKKKINALVQ